MTNTNSETSVLNPLRDIITNAYRMDETKCVEPLLSYAKFAPDSELTIETLAKKLVITARKDKKLSKLSALLLEYHLATDEGIALMCLAEALLRIPDTATQDKFIADKIATLDWKSHLDRKNSLFINAATWSLLLTGTLYSPLLNEQKNLTQSLKRAMSRVGISMLRPIIMQMMKQIGDEFIMGQTIETALKRSAELAKLGYEFSFDMLGEAARTDEDAKHYFAAYVHALNIIGQTASADLSKNHGISVKLSALYPRYEYNQQERAVEVLSSLLLTLVELAKKNRVRLIVDAEEADRLDLSLDIFERVFSHPILADWDGLGLAVQAYQKRAFYVLDWIAALAKKQNKRIIVRLVKGAYWDTEIKISQVAGFENYPVLTRKNATDVSYLACAKKMLALEEVIYSQFGTHNAYSIAAILEMATHVKHTQDHFEFQCLHGMGRSLYGQLVKQYPCRIYAPVGTHKDLLGYLVRRLLENGANNSFVNQLTDDKISIDKLIYNPIARIAALAHKPHPLIPLPKNIYPDRENSLGIDLSNRKNWSAFKNQLTETEKYFSTHQTAQTFPIISPSNINDILTYVEYANETDVERALMTANTAQHTWALTSVEHRAAILEKAAILFQENLPKLTAILTREAGKCILDCISEIRETIDYCRYYAMRACADFTPAILPGPTGEFNQFSLHPRGIIICISPWNFPLAIFTGQIVAALVTGNTVIAKPALQTPLIAKMAIDLLHQAGIPLDVLQLIIGRGNTIGNKLVSDERIAGVMLTGSTATAKNIEQSLAKRRGPIACFIAETGGQNAMILDSSALPEQAVIDIAQSAFNSAGQRCSALRVLFVQEEIAEKLFIMFKGYMANLVIGNPQLLSTDIGPVIDDDALQMLKQHYAAMQQKAKLIAEVPLNQTAPGHFFAPCVFEIEHLNILKGEVFGPILHVIRYRSGNLEHVMQEIIATGYGLTLGIQSRIDSTVEAIANRMPIGNTYVNRNMIGAVVGVQPFGGERLSGTGPKAGGPYYLPRLCIERSISINTTAIGGNARLVSLLEEK